MSDLWADGRMMGLDLETDGKDPFTALPVSFAIVAFDKGEIVRGRAALVNPGRPIDPEATKIHGITDEMVAAKGGNLEKSVNGIVEYLLEMVAMGVPLAGDNLRYDLIVIDTLSRRFNRHGLRELGWDGLVLDALVLDRHVDRYRTGKRTLSALCHIYQVAFGEAHDAGGDVVASYEVIRAIAARYGDIRRAPLEMVHLIQQEAHYEWAVNFSQHRVDKGEPPLEETEFGWPLPGEIPKETL